MIGIVVVTHGRLASEMLHAAELVVGPVENACAVDILPTQGMEEIHKAIESASAGVDQGDGVILLTDMFGGTPSNIGISFLGTRSIEIVTGVNLPMMVKLPTARATMPLPELAQFIRDYGRRNITTPGEMLKGVAVPKDGEKP